MSKKKKVTGFPFKFKRSHVHNWNQVGPPELIVHMNLFPWHYENYEAMFYCDSCKSYELRPVQDLIDCCSSYALTYNLYWILWSHLWMEVPQNNTKTIVLRNIVPSYTGETRDGYNGY